MNKLDALIDACRELEETGRLRSWSDAEAFRRVLEAVREDMERADMYCLNRRACGECTTGRGVTCQTCPQRRHAATRAALEDLA